LNRLLSCWCEAAITIDLISVKKPEADERPDGFHAVVVGNCIDRFDHSSMVPMASLFYRHIRDQNLTLTAICEILTTQALLVRIEFHRMSSAEAQTDKRPRIYYGILLPMRGKVKSSTTKFIRKQKIAVSLFVLFGRMFRKFVNCESRRSGEGTTAIRLWQSVEYYARLHSLTCHSRRLLGVVVEEYYPLISESFDI
jgi:hypothetical protein